MPRHTPSKMSKFLSSIIRIMFVHKIEKEFNKNEVRIDLKNDFEKDYSKIVLKGQPDPHN